MTHASRDWKEEFKKKIESKNWGACFECCDYENMMQDLKNFIQQALDDKVRECAKMARNQATEYIDWELWSEKMPQDQTNQKAIRTCEEVADSIEKLLSNNE